MPTETEELKDRIAAKRKRTEARIHELKADGSEASREKAKALKEKLDEVSQSISDGYENLKQDAASKLNAWLKDD